MPEIRLELPADLLKKLETEVDLLGFADRDDYLRWIVGNRAAIEQGTERDQLLTEYQARVDELESQLEANDERLDTAAAAGRERDDTTRDEQPARGSPAQAGGSEGDRGRSRATDGSGTAASSDDATALGSASVEEPTAGNGPAASAASESNASTGGRSGPGEPEADTADAGSSTQDGPSTGSTTEPVTQTAGSASQDTGSAAQDTGSASQDTGSASQDTGSASDARESGTRETDARSDRSTGAAGSTQTTFAEADDDSDGTARGEGDVSTSTSSLGARRTASEDDARSETRAVEDAAKETVADLQGNFRPERVERFEDESLGSHANQLRGVEGERLDEFARRAVAKTRERLGREPSTGLDYRSQTRIATASSDVRPGEDLVDLDSLDVPGRSEEAMAPRREAVGAALAYLRDVDRAKRSDFVEELYEDYPAGYDSKSGWWRCMKRGLKDARVVEGGDGSRIWRYVPPGSREGELVGSGPKRIVDPD